MRSRSRRLPDGGPRGDDLRRRRAQPVVAVWPGRGAAAGPGRSAEVGRPGLGARRGEGASRERGQVFVSAGRAGTGGPVENRAGDDEVP